MRLRTRLVLLVGASVGIGIVVIAIILSWLSWRAIQAQAESEGQVIARLLAQSVSVSEQVVADIESILDQEMIAQGLLASHLADLADQAGLDDRSLGRRLGEIAARSSIDELWISDAVGIARAASADDSDPSTNMAQLAGLPPRASGSSRWGGCPSAMSACAASIMPAPSWWAANSATSPAWPMRRACRACWMCCCATG